MSNDYNNRLKNTSYNPDNVSPYSISKYWILNNSNKLSFSSPIKTNTYVGRYSSTRVINNNGNNYLETFNQIPISESSNDKYHTTTLIEINRLDIVAFNYYGLPYLWWIIAIANDIIDPFNVPLGTVLRIPPLESLYLTRGVLSYNG